MSDIVAHASSAVRTAPGAWTVTGTVKWAAIPWERVLEGVSQLPFFSDPAAGVRIELAKLERGAEIPEHFHATAQTLFLVAGRLRARDGHCIQADTCCVIPAGELHGPFVAEESSLLLSVNR